MFIRSLVQEVQPIRAEQYGIDAYRRFKSDPDLLAIAVIDAQSRPVGMLTRTSFALKMADQSGRSLYDRRPVTLVMNRDVLILEMDAPITTLNAAILTRFPSTLLEGFIIVENGAYRGVGTGLDVLRATATEAQTRAEQARSAEQTLLTMFSHADATLKAKRAAAHLYGQGDKAIAAISGAPASIEDLTSRIAPLFAEIAERDEALMRATKESEQANRAKSAFLANTSHELRTPLNAIIGYAELLQEEAEARDDAAFVKDGGRIAKAGKQLLHLINDILDMSKIEAGRLQVCADEFEVSALIEECASMIRRGAEANGNRLDLTFEEGLGCVESDGFRLKQCLLNLLSNAAKFTRDGVVSVHARRVGGEIEIAVSDTGIGIDETQIACLFEPFTQATAKTAQQFGGTGLGLPIASGLMRLLGGHIGVESRPGEGTTFTLHFPAILPQALAEAHAA